MSERINSKVKSNKKVGLVMAKIEKNDSVSFKANELKFFTKQSEIVGQFPALYDERLTFAVSDSLARSLKQDGQKQNIIVTLIEEHGKQEPYVVVGNQRVKAALSLGEDFELRATLMPFDVQNIVYTRIVENELRTNNTPVMRLQTAAFLRSLKDEAGNELFSVNNLADRFGVSPVQVYQWIKVNELLELGIPGMKQAVDYGRIKVTTLAEFTKESYLQEDGKLNKPVIAQAFELAMKNVAEGGVVSGKILRETTRKSNPKPKQEDLRKILSYPKTPYVAQLLIHFVFGDNDRDKTVDLARANGVEIDWFIDALNQETEKKINAKGAGRKAKRVTAESELL